MSLREYIRKWDFQITAEPRGQMEKEQSGLCGGKVLIDWSQNDDHKTTICVYSI